MKNYISKRLYTEGLTRVRTPGIIAAVLTVLFSVSVPFTALMNQLANKADVNQTLTVVGAKELSSPLLILLLATPLFAIASFRFLNKRNTSDFYHALPYTRTSIFFSFLLGILTWISAIAVVSVTLRAIIYAITPRTVVQFGAGLLGALSHIIACMVLLGYILLALSLTGTRFSNVAVFLILYILPRHCLSLLWETLETVFPMLDITALPYTLFSDKYALVQVLLSGSIGMGTNANLFVNPFMLLYHFLLAIGLFALGALAFKKRPSESAGNPSTSRRAQHIWRLLAALPLALSAVSVVITGLYEEMEDAIVSVVAGAVLLFLSAAVYILYELFSTGKLRRVGGVILRFFYLLIPMALFALLVLGGKSILLNREIAPEDMESVTFADNLYFEPTWEHLKTGNMKVTDPTILSAVQKGYEENLAALSDGTYEEKYYDWKAEYTYLDVAITTKNGKTRTYHILFPEETVSLLQNRRMEIEEYRDAYLSMPGEKNVEYIMISGLYMQDASFYRAFLSQYENLSAEEKIALKTGMADNVVCEISVSGTEKGTRFYSCYYVSASMTELMKPLRQTLNQSEWRGESNAYATNMQAVQSVAQAILDGDIDDEYFYFDVITVAENEVKGVYYDSEDLEKYAQTFTALCNAVLADDGNTDSPYYVILTVNFEIDGYYEHTVVSVSVTEEVASLLFAQSEE